MWSDFGRLSVKCATTYGRLDNQPALWAGMIDGIIENASEVKQVLEAEGVPIMTPREAISAVKTVLENAEKTS
jgi:hypothetical protein